ncbi:hypothetical protein GHT06_007839 [Daphnia sinensis]|uniref:Uncharacterized protein n=1 Tax=Daphnia sinensis TaxID=1820382 RepID=A0AAD5LJY1_9CRUS|nr:hypothetical protein GHT06_007839 [Daphnia sinensis]
MAMRFTEAAQNVPGKTTLNLPATTSLNKHQRFAGGRWTTSAALALIASNVKCFLETMLSFKDANHYLFAERRPLCTRIREGRFYSHIPSDLKSILNKNWSSCHVPGQTT